MASSRTKYDGRVLPRWADGLGWCLTVTCVLPILIFAVLNLTKTKKENPEASILEVRQTPISPCGS